MYESPRNVCIIHVVWLPLSDVHPCLGVIPESFSLAYTDLYYRKLEEANSRANKKKSMTDSIDNIQERTSSAMSMASSAKMSAASASTMASASAVSASAIAIARSVAGSERANKRGVCV